MHRLIYMKKCLSEAIDQGCRTNHLAGNCFTSLLIDERYQNETKRIQNFVDSFNISLMTGMPHAEYFFNPETAPEEAKPLKNSKAVYTSYNSILFFTAK